jgi:hypothetical protein
VWTVHAEEATAGSGATLSLHFTADDVYLVLGGRGTVRVDLGGAPVATVRVSGVPRLYTLLSGTALRTGLLTVHAPAGIEAYDFTFG